MTPIKLILIILLVIVLRAFLVQPSLLLAKRLFATAVFAALTLLVVFPDASTKIANVIGVGRGVDLIFYLSHLSLLLLIIMMWRKIITLNDKLTRISRQISLENPIKKSQE
jgi:hypothetical protein